MGNVTALPGAVFLPLPHSPSLNLSRAEVEQASGGYVRPAEQLKALHGRGFVRAFRRNGAGPVILERAHYDAVVRGQFGNQAPANDYDAPRLPPNRTGYRAKFGKDKTLPRGAHVAQHPAFQAYAARRRAEAVERRATPQWAQQQEQRKVSRRPLVAFHAAKRRAARLERTPAWAEMDAIRAVYAEARRLTKETGIEHHVDHDYPLQGELVSGLHVHNNLQILTGAENSRKKNRFEVQP